MSSRALPRWHVPFGGMSRFFDSKQGFAQRVDELGMGELINPLKNKGWVSFGILAFVTEFVPGTSPPEIFLNEVVKPLVGDNQADIDRWKPLLKRLFMEAYTLAAHDIQSRSDGPDPDAPRKMPSAEREYRLTTLQTKLAGLVLEGELLPSHSPIDICSNMFEVGQVSYVPWEKCTKRDAETTTGTKVEKVWKPDSDGRIRESSVPSVPSAELGTDLLLRYTLQRRGLALEVANVCDFATHELWVGILFDAMITPPPPGYAKVSWNQLRRADEEMFRRIARECRDGLRWMGGRPPFELAMKSLLFDPSIRLMLMPLPTGGAAAAASASSWRAPAPAGAVDAPSGPSKRALRRQKRQAEMAAKGGGRDGGSTPKVPRVEGPKGGGKDAGKGGNFKAMEGKVRNLPSNGEPICFNYNIRGCPNAAPGQRCPRGWHVCAETGCQKNHPMFDHPR